MYQNPTNNPQITSREFFNYISSLVNNHRKVKITDYQEVKSIEEPEESSLVGRSRTQPIKINHDSIYYVFGNELSGGGAEVLIMNKRGGNRGLYFLFHPKNGSEIIQNSLTRLEKIRKDYGDSIKGRLVTPQKIQNLEQLINIP